MKTRRQCEQSLWTWGFAQVEHKDHPSQFDEGMLQNCLRKTALFESRLLDWKNGGGLILVSRKEPCDEYSALNALIHDRGAQWSRHVRAIKFDIEFKAIEEERRRVAKELHDEVLPLLARLIRSIRELTKEQATAEPWRLEHPDKHEQIIDCLHKTVDTFRDLLAELHPFDLEEFGLVSALNNLCDRYVRLSKRSIAFNALSEECNLSEHQQLCLFRAAQTVLAIFAASNNDILIFNCDSSAQKTAVTMTCVDKRVAASDWLFDHADFRTVESWCSMAGAELSMKNSQQDPARFPCDLTIEASSSQPSNEDVLSGIGQITRVRLKELDSIIATAQEEWVEQINRDCALFRKLAVELERKRVVDKINKSIVLQLATINRLASESNDKQLRKLIKTRMASITDGVKAVIAELHPHLIDKVGLVASLRTLVARFRHATMIETTMISNLWAHQFETIPMETKFALYRVVQEALNNIEKHSDATRTLVTVTTNAEQLIVCIEDNGKGISPTER